MSLENSNRKTSESAERVPSAPNALRTIVVALSTTLIVSACSSVPDAVNPVEWYRATIDAFSSDEEDGGESGTTETGEVPGADDEFPSLSSVPARPAPDADVAEGLIADPNAPKYAPAVTLQGEDDSVAFPTAAAAAPEAPAVPVEPVQSEANASTVEFVATAPAAPDVPSAPEALSQISAQPEIAAVPQAVSAPLVIQPGVLPSGETYEEYRARLMQGLEQSGSSFAPTTGFASAPSAAANLDTVVVSSVGIEQQAGLGVAVRGAASSSVSEGGFAQLDSRTRLVGPNSVKVATIHFGNGSDGLDRRDRNVLRQVAALHAKNGGVVRVIGHASSRTASMDEVRHKLVNYRVSAQRADAVANELVRLGLPRDAIYVGAASDRNPVYLEVMPTGEAGNRRAEIYIDS